LGGYDARKWRFFEFTAAQAVAEYGPGIVMSPGKAFWLLTKDGMTLETGPGVSLPTDSEYPISLNAGWTLVGNPFNFQVPVFRLRLATGGSVQLRSYTGSWNTVTAMDPFSGYAIASQGATMLFVNPAITPTPKLEVPLVESRKAGVQWSITIHARCQDAVDGDGEAVVSEYALTGLDEIDSPEPPVIGGYVSVYFDHPEWGGVLRRYSVDARPIPQTREAWRFEVSSNIRDVVWLNFGGVEQVPAQFDVVLVDELMKTAADLRSRGSYEFASPGEKLKQSFTLLVGRPESIQEELKKSLGVPVSFELGQNFPNPFNPVTTIGYGVPVESNVSLKVYDLPGRVVEVLVEGIQGVGRHAVIFNGKVLASGTYYYRMVATARDGSGASFTEVKRLVLIK
jgi:hypothetical protein